MSPAAPGNARVRLEAGDASVTVAPDDGCRLASLVVADHELLVTSGPPPWHYGSFVMAPWAGRIRLGRATLGGWTLTFATVLGFYVLHGLVHSTPWQRTADASWMTTITTDAWFGPLEVHQRVALRHDRLDLELEVIALDADAPAPATVGWHPWFVRALDGAALHLDVPAQWMLERAADGVASDRRVAVPDGPWDDTFGGLTGPVTLTWPGVLHLEVHSDAPVMVVYTEPDHAVCVEPQSGPPDEVNIAPRLVTPEDPLRLTTSWCWRTLG